MVLLCTSSFSAVKGNYYSPEYCIIERKYNFQFSQANWIIGHLSLWAIVWFMLNHHGTAGEAGWRMHVLGAANANFNQQVQKCVCFKGLGLPNQ